jgi:hypothetical protein
VFLGDLQRQKNDREKKQGSMGAGLEGEPMTSVEPHQKKMLIFTAGELLQQSLE